MKKQLMIPTLLMALLFTAGSAFAWGGGYGRNCSGPGARGAGMGAPMTYEQHQQRASQRLERMAVVLDLTADQKQQLADLFDQQWKAHQALRDKMLAGRAEMNSYRSADTFNEAEFRAIAQKQADLRTEMMVQRAKMQQAVSSILTPEQRVKADQLKEMGWGFFGRQGGRSCDGPGRSGGAMMRPCGPGCRS
ncbi:Spy/CpxP family protein refolding chaperone [Pelobacter seleniigenes]|uniref:Spy/CpxP family protein refolding chaperone n=1 Tax=Pelobacter seleniigenes TaxID=407188 RepID=UPI00068BCD0D|nr:Spy/CpxP family protein refolding chaperone [Pelobacter seleniigenes]